MERQMQFVALPLRNLPFLALREVIRSMGFVEQIKLAALSNPLEQAVRCSRIYVDSFQIHFENELSSIVFNDEHVSIAFADSIFYNESHVSKSEISRWTKYETDVEILEAVEKRLKSIYICKRTLLFLYFPMLENLNFKEIPYIMNSIKSVSEVILATEPGQPKNYEISSKVLEFLMKSTRRDVFFETRDLDISIDFRTEHPFNFSTVMHSDARWIQFDDLLSIRNLTNVLLKKTNFSCAQLNSFLGYWVDSDVDMFGFFKMDFDARETSPFTNLIVMRCTKTNHHYAISNPNSRKQKKVLCINFADTWVEMATYSVKEKQVEFTILTNLMKEKELGERLETEMEEEEKQRIREEIEELKEKLDELKLINAISFVVL